jgi:hypothetical protein
MIKSICRLAEYFFSGTGNSWNVAHCLHFTQQIQILGTPVQSIKGLIYLNNFSKYLIFDSANC